MPRCYWVECERCAYRAYRYCNTKRCPDCGGDLVRAEVPRERHHNLAVSAKGATTAAPPESH